MTSKTMKKKLEDVFGKTSWDSGDYIESISELDEITDSPKFKLMAETWKIYKIYKTVFLGDDFAPRCKIGEIEGRVVYIGRKGIGYAGKVERPKLAGGKKEVKAGADIMWELIPEISITAISRYGKKIAEHLEGKKKDRLIKFWEIIRGGDFHTNYNNMKRGDASIAKGIRRKLIEEFKPTLVEENI